MKISQSLIAVVGVAGVASAERRWEKKWANETVWTTEIVTAFTTFCPAATTVVQNNKTYTVTEATTLTITNCPCTVSSIVTPVITTTLPVPTAPTVAPVGPSATSAAPAAGKTTTAPKTTPTPIQAAGAGMLGSSLAAVILGGAIAILF